jgi:hypothetical protein
MPLVEPVTSATRPSSGRVTVCGLIWTFMARLALLELCLLRGTVP